MATRELYFYAGIGPASDPDLIRAATGKPPLHIGPEILVACAELCVQNLDDIPDVPISEGGPSVRGILRSSYGDGFEGYGLRWKGGKKTSSRYFGLDAEQKRRMMAWDFVNEGWHREVIIAGQNTPEGSSISAVTTLIGESQSVTRVLDGTAPYPLYLVEKELMIAVAEQACAAFDEGS